jgi:hypothetical protein
MGSLGEVLSGSGRIDTVNLTAEAAQQIRHRIMLAPERVDYRDRALLNMPAGVRQGEMYFRHTGVLLPYGCSITDFDTPNP